MMLGVGGSGQPSCTAASGWISGKSTSPAASTADGARRYPQQRMAVSGGFMETTLAASPPAAGGRRRWRARRGFCRPLKSFTCAPLSLVRRLLPTGSMPPSSGPASAPGYLGGAPRGRLHLRRCRRLHSRGHRCASHLLRPNSTHQSKPRLHLCLPGPSRAAASPPRNHGGARKGALLGSERRNKRERLQPSVAGFGAV